MNACFRLTRTVVSRGVSSSSFLSSSSSSSSLVVLLGVSHPPRVVPPIFCLGTTTTSLVALQPLLLQQQQQQQQQERWYSSPTTTTKKKKKEKVILETLKKKYQEDPQQAEEWWLRQHSGGKLSSSSSLLEEEEEEEEYYKEGCVLVLESWCWHSQNYKPIIARIRAKRWLDILIREFGLLDMKWMNSYLHVCSRSNEEEGQVAAEHVSSILEDLLRSTDSAAKVTTETFQCVIRAWTRCRSSVEMPHQVMKWVRTMEHHARNNNNNNIIPNTTIYCMAMDAWAVQAGRLAKQYYFSFKKQQQRPPLQSHHPIREALEKVEGILEYMTTIHQVRCREDEENAHVIRPDTVAYNTLLSAYVKVAHKHYMPDLPYKAERVMQQMIMMDDQQQQQPDERTYMYIMQLWIKYQNRNRADWWLRQAMDNHKVTTQHYNLFLSLDGNLWEQFQQMKLLLLEPNTETFSILIHTSLNKQNNVEQAYQFLCQILHEYPHLKTTPEMFLSILKYMSFQNNHNNHHKMAKDIFQHYQRCTTTTLDTMAYVYLLKILPPNKEEEEENNNIVELLQDCCQQGLFSKPIRTVLCSTFGKSILPSHEYDYYVRNNYKSYPKSWSRNVKPTSLQLCQNKHKHKNKQTKTPSHHQSHHDTNKPQQHN